MNNQKRGFTAEMIVEFGASILMIILFFIPWLNITFYGGISGARLFSTANDILQYTDSGAIAYMFLLLYAIPVFAIFCIIFFATQNKKMTRSFFMTMCIVAAAELSILLILCISATSNAGELGRALISLFAELGVGFWLTLVSAVGGLVYVIIAASMDKSSGRAAGAYAQKGGNVNFQPAHKRFVLSVVSGEYMGANIPVPAEGLN
ncbi:MAG: hypothetical protein PHO15_07210, partial [Eubacteriales bacterium]|nr:hypothetical protein [Eubacteriales bacterium]